MPLLVGLGACASNELPPPSQHAGLSCVDDSVECIGRRQSALKQLMSDQSRGWVKEPATPHGYATGVRLFAFKSKKRELSCDELAVGVREAESAPGVLRGSGGSGLTPAQVSRGVMLAAEVARELNNERGRRCKRA